jgi:hypothetical protein
VVLVAHHHGGVDDAILHLLIGRLCKIIIGGHGQARLSEDADAKVQNERRQSNQPTQTQRRGAEVSIHIFEAYPSKQICKRNTSTDSTYFKFSIMGKFWASSLVRNSETVFAAQSVRCECGLQKKHKLLKAAPRAEA